MKTKFCFYLFLVLSSLFAISFAIEDSCPSGMRKLFVDDKNMVGYGSARPYMAAISYFQFPGSLFFARKVLIEPRFEVHLKAQTDPIDIVEKEKENKLYGFTIVISGYKNTISGLETRTYTNGNDNKVFTDIGYNNFVNSLIIEFDFEQDLYDPDSSSFSLRYCSTECHSYDRYAFYKAKLTSQRYDPRKTNYWDFRLVYVNKKLILYSGPNDILYSLNADLEATLGTNIAYTGFTGFIESNRREISIIGSFICEDNYQLPKMPGNFYINKQKFNTAVYEAGAPINYIFSFINDKDQLVPHTYGYNIWNYTFNLTTDCGHEAYSMTKDTNYTLLLAMKACTKAGKHALHITEEKKGDAPERYYTVIAGPLYNIELIGHDEIIAPVPSKKVDDTIYLTYGDSLSGDFVIKKDLQLVLDFNMTDQYGNIAEITSPATLFNLKKVDDNGALSAVTSNILSYTMKKVGEHYQMTLVPTKVGTYQIDKNQYMKDPIRFSVIPGEVSATMSICTLGDYQSPPTLEQSQKVYYNCYLRDSYGNEIKPQTFLVNSYFDFSCKTQRTAPTEKSYINTHKDGDNYFACEATTSETGDFTINGYLTQKGTNTPNKINSKINTYSVRGNPDALILKNIQNLYDRNWLNINGAALTYKYDEAGLLTILDLAEADGTLISSYRKYPDGFDIKNLKAEFYSDHDLTWKFGDLEPRIITIDGAEYIGIYTADKSATDKLVKKSSFDYAMRFTLKRGSFGDDVKVVSLKYLINIGTYTTCFHNFEPKNTYLDQEEPIELLTGGAERKIGKIELKTTDFYLYNYDIGKEKIEYLLEPKSENITFRIVPLSIEGTYDVYAKATGPYEGYLTVKVAGVEIKKTYINTQPSLACYLEFKNPELFKHLGTTFKEHYYEYLGDFVDGNLQFFFIIKDKYNNTIVKEDYFSAYADIYSEQYGNDITRFKVGYNYDEESYQFRDNLPFETRKYSWVFFMRDSTCNNKYYIRYDGMRGGTPVSLEKSYYTLLKNEINVNEYGYVDVFYKDENDQFLGLQEGKLEEMKEKTTVKATDKSGKVVHLEFDSITSGNAIRYKQKFDTPGNYTVKVTADGTDLKCSNSDLLTVIDNSYSLKHSKLQVILDTVIDMDPNIRVTIDNTVQRPVYKLYFYTASGQKTTYPKDEEFKCVMTGPKGVSLDLDVTKKNDYVQFTYKDKDMEQFVALTKGDYELKVSDTKESVDYPLYLTGDGSDDTSNDPNYDIDKTEVYPTHIDGVAGKTYTVTVVFKTADGFRWNYVIDPTKFSFSNSYGLGSDQFTTKVEPGYKRGQALVYVTQNLVTNGTDNILTLYYDGKKIPKTVSLTIKNGDFAKLVYVDGPSEGNVINPPILTFKPVDSFGNLYTEWFTNPTSQDYLNSLTVGKSLDGVPLGSNNYLADNQYLKVQYLSHKSTNVVVTSPYFDENYPYRIRSGPIDKDTSYAELKTAGSQPVGSNYHIVIYPKDIYYNDIDDLGEEDMKKFFTYYDLIGESNKNKVTDCQLLDENTADTIVRKLAQTADVVYDKIECQTTITKVGSMAFHVDYVEDEIECRNCEFFVIIDDISSYNTKALYKNKNIYLDPGQLNEVQAKVDPVFELTFFDRYFNQLGASDVQKLDIEPTLEGTDIKLCISNVAEKKVITLCPASNGDDNVNKWQYVTNGDNYKLVLTDKNDPLNSISYPIKIVGGSNDGSSDDVDLGKTKFEPEEITVTAGEEGETIMELRTADGSRKNYWYPNPAEKIKVDFDKNQDSCTYSVDKADLPGRYSIKVVCTKADTNAFSVTVDGEKVDQKVKLNVLTGPAYYLEAEDVDKFIVSSDKYTFKTNPTNDDTVEFSFKLLDKYKNYITHSVLGNNEITIASETFGSSDKLYDIKFNDDKIDYDFTDKIEEPVTKHVWDITCLASNRKYSFIYTRVPGKVDVDKSDWTIDKTNYIIYENSTVLVTLRDRLGVNVGTVEGRLLKEKDLVKVVTNNGKDALYDYNSITNDNEIKYKYNYTLIGNYKVSVTYDGKQIKEKKDVTVSYPKIDLKTSKLYYDLFDGKENLMLTTVNTNINNKKDYLFYKFYLYTAAGEKINVYDKRVTVTCKMTYGENEEWDLDVEKGDNFFKFTYQDGFRTVFEKLPLGLYYIVVTLDGESIKYPLYLLGDKDVSPSNVNDPTKTYINPTYIDGIAGVQYTIDVEFRAKDNLRWNYEVIPDSFEIANSYGLDDKNLKIEKQSGENNGQLKLLVTQYVASTGGVDNVLSFKYKGVAIPTTVTLHIKSGDLFVLEYDSGAVDGTVVNPSIVKFIPKDKYGNIYTDLFDEKLYPKEKLESLTNGVSEEGYDLTTNNWVSDGKYLNVQYGSKKVTTIKLTCNYNLNPNTYRYKLWAGPIDPDQSYAEVEKTDGVRAGDITNLHIYPKDIYGNDVTNVTDDDLKKFDVDYEVNNEDKTDISDSCEPQNSKFDDLKCHANVTKAGDAVFTVDYEDKPIKCKNCEFVINPDVIDFSKTKTFNKNENKEMSKTELNKLPSTINPNFELFFFDRFMNPVTDKEEVKNLDVGTKVIVTDVKLCVKNNDLTKLSSVCKSENNDENEKKWQYLPDGDNYKLVVTNLKTNENLTYPIGLTGGYKDGSGDKIDPNKTDLNPSEITLVAGEPGSVSLQLRTPDDKRKNYWFDEPEKHISVVFPEDVTKCTYTFEKGENPGDYNINFNCTEKKDPFPAKVLVDGEEVPKPLTITVVPGGPAKSRLFRMTGEEILESDLGKVSVEDKFQMINRLYDKYDNLITNINFALSSLEIKMNPSNSVKGHTWSAEPVSQNNGDILITLKSTYAGEHIVTGKYFPLDKYKIIFTPGAPNADNSELEVSKTEAFAGEEIRVFITPYDKYNNYIDAKQFENESPYQVKYTDEQSNSPKVILEKPIVESRNDLNVLSYPAVFYVKGITTVSGFIDLAQIKCVSCRVNIKTKDIDFLNSLVQRFEPTKNDFETLKNGTVEKNAKDEPIYRLYPRDKYSNGIDAIPKDQLVKYTAYLRSQNESTVYNLKLNNKVLENQPYAEFVIDDDANPGLTYKTLVGGYYDLVFTDGKDELVYNITLAGDGKGGSNEPADYQKTAIIQQNLKYIAGNTGYMMVEIRTSKNVRKNYWDGFEFKVESCDADDKTFDYVQERAGELGIFLITVTTQRANTFPTLRKCPLKLYLNNELITDLKPEQEVSPDAVVRTNILEKYYKDGSKTNLLDGNADTNYVFEVESFDQYDNFAETLQEVVGVKVALKGGEEVTKLTSETNYTTGYRKYSLPVTKAGTYVVSTDKVGPKGLYMSHESYFVVHPGAIDLSKTIIKEKATPIQAGSYPAISIEAFDKNGNALEPDSYIGKFTSVFKDAGYKNHTSKGAYDNDIGKVFYTSETPVTIVGTVRVDVTYDNKEKLDTSKVLIEVIPGDPDPSKSILSRETSKGFFTQYKNGDNFTVNVKELLILNITLYDKYNNYISQIPADVEILIPTLSGNDMENISFTVTQNTGYFGLDFNDNPHYLYVYQHLVSGTYDLTYTVSTSTAKADFKYGVIVDNGDDKHGNGPYVIDKCLLYPKNATFVAGTYQQFTLELRTEKGLLYNDDIDLNKDLDINIDQEDKSFKYTVAKAGSENGIYTITIYSEKKGDYSMNVLLADPADDMKKKNVGPAYYTVLPDKVPDKRYTVFYARPNDTVKADTPFEIAFTLADKFNNLFEDRTDIVDNHYLTLLNNNETLEPISFTLDPDGKTYRLKVYPKYPPKKMVMNTIYNDGDNSVYCFMDDIVVNIIAEIDYNQTQIVSSNKEKIQVGEVLDMWLYTFDKNGECLDDKDYSDNYTIKVEGPLDSSKKFTKVYKVRKTNRNKDAECDNEYQIITTEDDVYTIAGNYIIDVIGGNETIATYNQVCIPLGYSLDGFLLDYDFDPNKISILDTPSFTVTGHDKYGNKVGEPLYDDLEIYFTQDNTNTVFESSKAEKEVGSVQFDVSIHKIGPHQLHILYKGQEVTTVNHGEKLPIFNVLPGPCRAETNEHFDLTPLDGVQKYDDAYFTFQCYDIYDNKITEGGEEFTVTANAIYNGNDYPVHTAKVIDNGDGTYNVEFIPEVEGTYLFNLLVGSERYGQEVKWILNKKECNGTTNILCPNTKECVSDILDCVSPPDKCKEDKSKPFWCKANGTYECVKSQTDCDCPEGFIKCDIMHYCVPENRPDMCAEFIVNNRLCKKYGDFKMFDDGICRPSDSRFPSQRVCPIGQVLCADLSCRDNYHECVVTPVCPDNKYRCIGQTITDSPELCPSTYSCPNEDDVVCSDGTCVSNEIYCPALTRCFGDFSYRCQNSVCAVNYESCNQGVACGHQYSLCSDNICRLYC